MYGSVHFSFCDSRLGSSCKNMTASVLPRDLTSFQQNLMTCLNINISNTVRQETIQPRREAEENPGNSDDIGQKN